MTTPDDEATPDVAERGLLVRRLIEDLAGPTAVDEVLDDRPSDRYLTGILFPQRTPSSGDEDEKLETEDDEADPGGPADTAVSLAGTMRPASCGVSFAARSDDGRAPRVTITIAAARYELEEDASVRGPATRRWRRMPVKAILRDVELKDQPPIPLEAQGMLHAAVVLRTTPWKDAVLSTAALVNTLQLDADADRTVTEEGTYFQVEMQVVPEPGTTLPARPSHSSALDEDGRAAELVYREAREFAVGHTCSATWESDDGRDATRVATSWFPRARVAGLNPAGATAFATLRNSGILRPLSARWLAEAAKPEVLDGLRLVPACYQTWIDEQQERLTNLPSNLEEQANRHLATCRDAAKRISQAVDLLGRDDAVWAAFRNANLAMATQRRWATGDADLTWRPFQVAFVLLTLPSVADRKHEDRDVMDLLWFPTGGGKTEAYLALIAFTLFWRRLASPTPCEDGVGALMRYTLRLLTTQQFQRAAALVMACESIRRGRSKERGAAPSAERPFSIGLWVGSDATPNSYKKAVEGLQGQSAVSPAQLEECPCCRRALRWRPDPQRSAILVECLNPDCELAQTGRHLPIWTVDDDVYREAPSLIIGTVDKFAQIVRKAETSVLFGVGARWAPPDLIIQDELHLISGPLGTLAGLYEAAIDQLCSRSGLRPKILGSTATIRRAEAQGRALFNRRTRQFPPPGLDHDNSGFAVRDELAPGRLYVGITSAGRSPKFALQAVCASLLQSAQEAIATAERRDPYWTLVTYFNSLRELGGALVLMRDDVPASVAQIATRRGESERSVDIVDELTSRVTQVEVRDKLADLARRAGEEGAIDVLLASNMLSVGVDIPRLGLMVVNGQPKGMAEYIQSTSRVGRGLTPGLVVTLYNNNKNRDRAHFESFVTWHQTLYRQVEATSVTPFSPRARDRALHAVVVALARHLVPGMANNPRLNSVSARALAPLVAELVARATLVDPDEASSVKRELEERLELWATREGVVKYWDDHKPNTALLMSAEAAAARRAAGYAGGEAWPTPNSLRNVEPGTHVQVAEFLAVATEGPNAEE